MTKAYLVLYLYFGFFWLSLAAASDNQLPFYQDVVTKKKISKTKKEKLQSIKYSLKITGITTLFTIILWCLYYYFKIPPISEEDPPTPSSYCGPWQQVDLVVYNQILQDSIEDDYPLVTIGEIAPLFFNLSSKDDVAKWQDYLNDKKITSLVMHNRDNRIAYLQNWTTLYIIDVVQDQVSQKKQIKLIAQKEIEELVDPTLLREDNHIRLFSYKNYELLLTDGRRLISLKSNANQLRSHILYTFDLRGDDRFVKYSVIHGDYIYGWHHYVDRGQSAGAYPMIFKFNKCHPTRNLTTFDIDRRGLYWQRYRQRKSYMIQPCSSHPDCVWVVDIFDKKEFSKVVMCNIRRSTILFEKNQILFCAITSDSQSVITFDGDDYKRYSIKRESLEYKNLVIDEEGYVDVYVDVTEHYTYTCHAMTLDASLLFVAFYNKEDKTSQVEVRNAHTLALRKLIPFSLTERYSNGNQEQQDKLKIMTLQVDPSDSYLFVYFSVQERSLSKPFVGIYHIASMLVEMGESNQPIGVQSSHDAGIDHSSSPFSISPVVIQLDGVVAEYMDDHLPMQFDFSSQGQLFALTNGQFNTALFLQEQDNL
ncbi:MAG: hypothetical protein AAF770_02525 [Bacteroidota bacterium]